MTHAYPYSMGSQTLSLASALEPPVLSATPECGRFFWPNWMNWGLMLANLVCIACGLGEPPQQLMQVSLTVYSSTMAAGDQNQPKIVILMTHVMPACRCLRALSCD